MSRIDKRDAMVRAIEAIATRMTNEMGDHSVARRLQTEANGIRLKAEALDNVNAKRSPLDTPAAHALKVSKLAKAFDREVTEFLNRSGRIYGEGVTDAYRRIGEKVKLQPDAFAQEIRTAFRELKGDKKMDLLTRLVNENRGPELAAIVNAPTVLTGITDQQRDAFEKAIMAKHAAAEMDEIEKLGEIFEGVSAISRAASTMVKEMSNPSRLAEIESQAAAADEAGAAFNQAMQ